LQRYSLGEGTTYNLLTIDVKVDWVGFEPPPQW
jgi:hypothetical protein